MKTVICLAFLLLAAQANPLSEFYLGFTQELHLDTELQNNGVQCINQVEDAIQTFFSLINTIKHPQSLQSILSLAHHLMDDIKSTIPSSCQATIHGLVKYWAILASNTNVKQNWERYHPEIIQAFGLDVFFSQINPTFHRSSQLAGIMFAEKFKWLLGISKPSDIFDTSSIHPTQIVPLDIKALIPQFISGFLRSLHLTNPVLVKSLSQCAVDLVEVALLFENGTHQVSEKVLMESLAKVIGSCKNAQQISFAYFEKNHLPMAHGVGQTLYLILQDAILNYPYYHKSLVTALVRLQEGNYEYSGRFAGFAFNHAFSSLVPLKMEVPSK